MKTSADSGVDATVPAALLGSVSKAVALGHGSEVFQALYEAFRRQ